MAWPNTVRKGDLIITKYRGSGPGGQHRNKTDSAVRIRHVATGTVASSEEHKSQIRNLREAFKRLAEKLKPLMLEAARGPGEPFVVDRQVIRTYHEKRGTVKDHRTGKSYQYEGVLDGDALDDLWLDLMRMV